MQPNSNALIDNLIRIGTVTAVRSGEFRVRTGDITPLTGGPTPQTGLVRTVPPHRLSLGEQVILLSVSGDLRNTYIVGHLNADSFPEPLAEDGNQDLDRTEYTYVTEIGYNYKN